MVNLVKKKLVNSLYNINTSITKYNKLRFFIDVRGKVFIRKGFVEVFKRTLKNLKWNKSRRFFGQMIFNSIRKVSKKKWRPRFFRNIWFLNQIKKKIFLSFFYNIKRHHYKYKMLDIIENKKKYMKLYCLKLFELRLDTFVFRLKIFPTVYFANQYIQHIGVFLNNSLKKEPSLILKEGSLIEWPLNVWNFIFKIFFFKYSMKISRYYLNKNRNLFLFKLYFYLNKNNNNKKLFNKSNSFFQIKQKKIFKVLNIFLKNNLYFLKNNIFILKYLKIFYIYFFKIINKMLKVYNTFLYNIYKFYILLKINKINKKKKIINNFFFEKITDLKYKKINNFNQKILLNFDFNNLKLYYNFSQKILELLSKNINNKNYKQYLLNSFYNFKYKKNIYIFNKKIKNKKVKIKLIKKKKNLYRYYFNQIYKSSYNLKKQKKFKWYRKKNFKKQKTNILNKIKLNMIGNYISNINQEFDFKTLRSLYYTNKNITKMLYPNYTFNMLDQFIALYKRKNF